jgi:hypothetical protein
MHSVKTVVYVVDDTSGILYLRMYTDTRRNGTGIYKV